jgi:hypothetical protein
MKRYAFKIFTSSHSYLRIYVKDIAVHAPTEEAARADARNLIDKDKFWLEFANDYPCKPFKFMKTTHFCRFCHSQ